MTRRWVLIYDYVEDVLERRAPHREKHLGLIRERIADGRCLMAGALGDESPHGALFIFEDAEEAEAFTNADPYVAGGVVRGWRVEPWNCV